MNTPIALILILLSIFAIPGTNVFGSSDLQVFVASSNGNIGLDMKATETSEVSDFVVKPESVVQITEGENLVVFTQPSERVVNVKVADSTGARTKLVSLGNNAYSLLGFAPGVYVLDVIVELPNSSDRAAYETILVILKQKQPPVQPIEVINKVKVVTDVKVTFEDDDEDDGRDRDRDRDKKCSDKPGSAGMGFPMNKRTECEKRDNDECKKNGFDSSNFCENQYELFNDDDCIGYGSQEECDEAYKPRDTEDIPKQEEQIGEDAGTGTISSLGSQGQSIIEVPENTETEEEEEEEETGRIKQ